MAPMKSPVQHSFRGVPRETFSLTHLARRWEMSRREVRHLLQSRQLPFVQVKGQFRVPRTAVLKFERERSLE